MSALTFVTKVLESPSPSVHPRKGTIDHPALRMSPIKQSLRISRRLQNSIRYNNTKDQRFLDSIAHVRRHLWIKCLAHDSQAADPTAECTSHRATLEIMAEYGTLQDSCDRKNALK